MNSTRASARGLIMKPITAYVLLMPDGYPVLSTCSEMRRDVPPKALRVMGDSWENLRKRGYRIQKIRIEQA